MPSFLADTPMGDWLSSPWLIGAATFLVWMAVLLLVRRFVLRSLTRMAARTRWTWDDVMVKALSGPLLLAILSSGLLVSERILPLSPEWDRALDVLLAASLALGLVIFADRVFRGLLDRLAGTHPILQGTKGLVQGMVRGALIALGLLIFLDSIGISITPILASLGIGSLAVGLALKDTLANLFAGIQMILDETVAPGHIIRIEGSIEGTVTRMGWRATRVLTNQNTTVIVPNAKLTESLITSFSLPAPEVDARLELGVHFDSDLDKVERVVLQTARDIARRFPEAATGAEPRLRFIDLADSSIMLAVMLRARDHEGSLVLKHHLIKTLPATLAREGIVIPFPTRTLDLPPERVEGLRPMPPGDDHPADAAGREE